MNGPYYDRHGVTVHAGDCLDVLRDLPDASVHAVICDPPYGLADIRPAQAVTALTAWANGDREHVPNGRGFMGRDWDAFVPPPAVWDECYRVLKPGGHVAAFAGSRTYDLMGLSIRLAGFEIRDGLQWLYGSGFPKSLDVSKAIDKAGGDPLSFRRFARTYAAAVAASEHTHTDIDRHLGIKSSSCYWAREDHRGGLPPRHHWERVRDLLALDASIEQLYDEAEREVIGDSRYASRRPRPGAGETFHMPAAIEDTAPATDAARQWQGWGTALKPAHEPIVLARKPLSGTVAATVIAHGTGALHVDACRTGGVEGRWPANVLLDEAAAAELDEQSGTAGAHGANRGGGESVGYHGGIARGETGRDPGQGGASRFFPTFRYQAKAPASERPQIDGISHPTVKPLTLMRWLVRLVTPPGGLVLDPFAGSGTTLQAAHAEGFHAIGIEREPKYLPLIKARLDGRPRAAIGTRTATDNEPMDLLDLLTEDGAA